MTTAIELPHLEGDLVTFLVGLGCLVTLVQLADFVVDCFRGVSTRRRLYLRETQCGRLGVTPDARSEVDDRRIAVHSGFVGREAM